MCANLRPRTHWRGEYDTNASVESDLDNEIVIIDLEAKSTPLTSISAASPAPRGISSQPTPQLFHTATFSPELSLPDSQDLVGRASPPSINPLGSGNIDPFGMLPGGLYDETLLVHHYNTQFIGTFTAPGPRKQWFPKALVDSAFYHSLMMISAGNVAGLQGKPAPQSFWYHRGEAIRQINARLTQIELAASDHTIATIAVLSIADCLEVEKTGVRAHKAALQSLISARGGMDEIDMLIQKLLGWIDLVASIVLVEPPIFNPARFASANHHAYYGPPSLSTSLYAADLNARLFNFTHQLVLCNDVARIYWGLRNLSILKATANSTDSTSSHGLQFSDRCELLEREVQQLLHSSLRESGPEIDNHNLIFTFFARASLLYIYSALRDLLMNVKMFQEVGNQLQDSLDMNDSDLDIFLGTFPDLMLWVLFLGGSVVDFPQKIWFSKTAARVLRACKVEDNNVKRAAVAFLWPEDRENYNDSAPHDTLIVDLHGPGFKTPGIPLLFKPINELLAASDDSFYK
ncbi:hypothetical protein O988_01861 [Pseudogymnoascus sp. VKM F-3808]|nr:hypothetical protein O988_01861 [Pseudogymnoascus sp. VKM F-3808]